MLIKNLFENIPSKAGEEIFETLLQTKAFKLERIISTGQATPAGQWYDQDKDEWIVLLSGKAGLLFEGSKEPHVLHPGDSLLVPAHARHRVEWTAIETETVWLALHFTA